MIQNKTKNIVLVKQHTIAHSLLSKWFGFMFHPRQDRGMVFIFNTEKKLCFHTFFMRFSLDFLFLNKHKKIVKIVRGVSPWKLTIYGTGMYVVELPTGRLQKTTIGDTISFK